MHTSMQGLNPSAELQNLFVALLNMDIFQMTLKFSLFNVALQV